ncbi:MAG: helix-turn-helix transcriptional regulator [Clostridia bacterium]|nr:helix-turn-helix transcriptional regulator [Clostridia bacterium]
MEEYTTIGIDTARPFYTVSEVFGASEFTARAFIERNYHKKLHAQEFYEINIVLRGSANHYIGARKITVSQGDTFIIPPAVMHGYDGGNGFDVCHVLLSPKFLEKHAASLQRLPAFSSLFRIDPLMREKTASKLHFKLCETEIASLMPRLDDLIAHSLQKNCSAPIVSESLALIVICELCEMYEKDTLASPAPEDEDAAFLSSIAYLYEHYNELLSIEALSKRAQMSRNAYIARFKRVMGEPPARFIKLYKLEMVKQMLAATALTEARIAHAVGCTDTSHMIRLFYSETGMTPSAYRKQKGAEE